MNPIILALLQPGGVVSIVLGIIKDHFARTGAMPTEQQVNDKLLAIADEVIKVGEEFLASHPAVSSDPGNGIGG
jgi:hypothetical protein